MTNSFKFTRRIGENSIFVRADYIEVMQVWGMSCQVNDIPMDHQQSVDPWFTAKAMIEEQAMNLQDAEATA